jgi:heme oxygenase
MFTDQLKESTLAKHQQTEKQLILRMKAMRAKEDYVSLLQMFYSYFGGLEQQINDYVGEQNLPDYNQRRKTKAIAADIVALGGVVPALADSEELPQIDNLLKAFGALYVIEGSTLGGKIIAGMMRQHFTFEGNEGLSFFSGYGDDTNAKWNAFKMELNAIAKTPAEEAEITEGANQTFEKFGGHISKSV